MGYVAANRLVCAFVSKERIPNTAVHGMHARMTRHSLAATLSSLFGPFRRPAKGSAYLFRGRQTTSYHALIIQRKRVINVRGVKIVPKQRDAFFFVISAANLKDFKSVN